MYVAVKGGERAIANAHALLADKRRGDRAIPEISPEQIDEQLALAVDRVMSEGSLYDRELAALAIKQARGDLIEAIFLVRAYRTTLPRFGFAEPVDTGAMAVRRRVSGDLQGSAGRPGARADLRLHPPTDRLFARARTATRRRRRRRRPPTLEAAMPRVTDIIAGDDLIERNAAPPSPARRSPTSPATRRAFPPRATRACRRWRAATRASCSASPIRPSAATAATIRSSAKSASARSRWNLRRRNSASPSPIGDIAVTECQMVNQFKGGDGEPPRFTRGYGLVFGQCERKAMSMALVDRALRAEEFGEERKGPAQDEEFVLSHSRQRAGDGLRRAPEAAALRRLPGGARRCCASCGASTPPRRPTLRNEAAE